MRKIYIGSDHSGFLLKEILKQYLKDLNYEVEDKGAFSLDNDDDYPDFVIPVAIAVASDTDSLGIILGASGQGEAICANKINGIRAIVYYGGNSLQKDINGNKLGIVDGGRKHNHANILSLGARFINEKQAKDAVKIFLETDIENDERHIRRINKIEASH
jgi:ribose 5-phosphate isomerase B